mmetsp:Transcript_70097/g.146173  ORF Transcript_70097/g.146173 Transcript_70097/m.146173 type:complete len:136 (-) Transcript_70097:168-575(-)|eukprot:CAMPEP_0181323874 /NCGR_PEP_ID=MMETSP1101-20121128/20037_1 /TAXON_ID=46948 /ORGANISM="Rhodomonas abbreviata, Strain Caron Lab Isolate" /LENGTH=135 /DNA_ID=CAMNT_0023431969 /DNA_START=59 /DNA_END=466 /DNA_ORIENTATION=+
MADGTVRETNPVADMENWKAAVMKEKAVASAFDENWGYLQAKPEECKPRAYETRLVKYFNKGVATVREKRLALEGEARGDTPVTPKEEKPISEEETKRMLAAAFRTTSQEYGSRGSLELFGVAEHGTKASITRRN